MTEFAANGTLAVDALQWGHGAWPWMTLTERKAAAKLAELQWGHGAWPWMTALKQFDFDCSGSFNGATAHGRG